MTYQKQWWTLEELTQPQHSTLHHYQNFWWAYSKEHDGYLVFSDSAQPETFYPQCNLSKALITKQYPDLVPVQIPQAFLPLNLKDYKD